MLRNTLNTFITATFIMLLGVSSSAKAIVPMGDLMGTTSVTFTGVEETKHSSTLTIALDPAKPAIEEITDEQIDNSVTVTYTITSRANGPDDYYVAADHDPEADGNENVVAKLTTVILDAGGGAITAPINLGATAATGPTDEGSRTITVICDATSTSNCNGIQAGDTVVIGDGDTAYTVATGGVSNTGEGPSTITLLDEGVELPSIALGDRIAERNTFKVVVSGDALLNPAKQVTFTLNVTAGPATPNEALTGTKRLTHIINAVEIKPTSERYARNLNNDRNPAAANVESTEFDSGGDLGLVTYYKTGVSAEQDDEVEILIVMNAGNQKDQTDIILKETLSPFVKFVYGSYRINNTPLTAEMNAFISRRSENARWLKSWHVTDPDGATPLTIPKNTSATITYRVKVIAGEDTPPEEEEVVDDGGRDAENHCWRDNAWVSGSATAQCLANYCAQNQFAYLSTAINACGGPETLGEKWDITQDDKLTTVSCAADYIHWQYEAEVHCY